MRKRRETLLSLLLIGAFSCGLAPCSLQGSQSTEVDRSPVDLVLGADESWLATANQTSGSVSLVDVRQGIVLDEVNVGPRPTTIAMLPDGKYLLVSVCDAHELVLLEVKGSQLLEVGRIHVGFEPHGMAITSDGRIAYVALAASAQVAVVDLAAQQVTARIDVGRWPRYLALSPDDKRLAVGTSGDRGVTIVDTATQSAIYLDQFVGLNIGHMQVSSDGRYAYFPWVVYRRNPITAGNIRLGWVLATRLARIRIDEPERREAMSLDPQGEAVADPHGLALTSDDSQIVVSASGTHELLVFRNEDLPFESLGSTDHIDRDLLHDRDRFARIPVGGRPMGLRIASDNRTVFVANYLDNSVQIVDLVDRQLTRTISLGGPSQPSLARRGEAIFYDGRRSLDQWYSCHTCHYEGGGNSVAIDTFNDGSSSTFKTVLPLYNVAETTPWTWHGWQTDLREAMKKSITSTMLGTSPSGEDVDALIAYLKTLELPPNPHREPGGKLTAAAERGRQLFESDRAACANCHRGPLLTDGENHDIGLTGRNDRYSTFNTPSLLGVHRKVLLLHDGRVESLRALLAGPHDPARVSGTEPLADDELDDLVEYLKSL